MAIERYQRHFRPSHDASFFSINTSTKPVMSVILSHYLISIEFVLFQYLFQLSDSLLSGLLLYWHSNTDVAKDFIIIVLGFKVKKYNLFSHDY